MIVIGITGTLGAGKGTIVDYLVKEKHFLHYSVRSFIVEEIEKRGIKVDRDSMTIVANELRAKQSPSYITDQLFEQAKQAGQSCVIESIRTPGEIESLRSQAGFYLFAVDANPKTRYERIKKRKSETDAVTYETFIHNETREMNSTDPNMQNIAACIKQADFMLQNDGSQDELRQQVESILSKIESNG